MLEMPPGSVRNIVKYYRLHGHSVVPPRSGRKKITDPRQDRRIVRAVEASRFISAARSAAEVQKDIGRKVSKWTIRSRIHAAGFNGRSARKKPYLSKKHRLARQAYAKKYCELSAEQWEDVFFTDEARLELHGTTGRVSVWRRRHESFSTKRVLPTFKSDRQSVMIWGSICGNGVGTLHICSDSVTGEYYRHILRSEVPITRQLNGLPATISFVQDNAPAHRVKLTKTCIKNLNLKDLGHPAQSPDLNPIENVLAEMKRELNRSLATSLDDLKLKLKRIWSSLDDEYIWKCVRSMPKRLDAVKRELGGHTNLTSAASIAGAIYQHDRKSAAEECSTTRCGHCWAFPASYSKEICAAASIYFAKRKDIENSESSSESSSDSDDDAEAVDSDA
ncbi:unnamed protein product [Phytophthora fragariaefolia]|uniref:Unnamed protein product n=1 Tax=Phytophthora fragariaefolia TaxID=1490495 RepID=A0A9W6TXH0_9STRA|nr:unnamed protein product [Phytophthora fragariaefolia]